jgi:hypothetical protein
MSPEIVSQLSVGGSTLVLLGGLMMLWRRGVPAHIGAFTFQSVALAATMAMVGWFAGDWQLWAVAAALLLVKGIGFRSCSSAWSGASARSASSSPT